MTADASDQTGRHVPVMLAEIVAALNPTQSDTIVDGTFGAGGYSRGVLEAGAAHLIGIDRDPDAEARANRFASDFKGRFTFVAGRFGDMDALLKGIGVSAVDGVVLDIGVSSFQIDQAARGFSFQADGPLDMRMSHEGEHAGETAADIVNTRSQAELADIFYQYGEERDSRRIAAAIVHDREGEPFTTTRQLASLLERLSKQPRKSQTIHPATRVFQALRIFVNDELGELRRGLEAAERLLRAGGRLVVVSFHSLEDRLVKQFLADRSGASAGGSRHMPQAATAAPSFTLAKRSALKPSKEECERNPRARSARLRAAIRTDAPVWQGGAS